MSTDDSIDRLVAKVNGSGTLCDLPEDVPAGLRCSDHNESGCFSWKIKAVRSARWLAAFERRLPKPYPPSFRSLIHRYSFAQFEVGPVLLFANTGDTDWDNHLFSELSVAIFQDKRISQKTMENGFVQFARPVTGGYDPICFDTNRSGRNCECPVVRIDHEEILCRDGLSVIEEVAPSFIELVQEFLDGR